MKEYLAPVMILGTFLCLMGMGGLGGTAPSNQLPLPEKNFTAKVVDREGIQTPLTQFSQEGKIFLTAKRGNGTITIPFEKISQVQFLRTEANETQAKVTLRGQESIEVKLDSRAKFYGQAEFGTFQIDGKDLKSISFTP